MKLPRELLTAGTRNAGAREAADVEAAQAGSLLNTTGLRKTRTISWFFQHVKKRGINGTFLNNWTGKRKNKNGGAMCRWKLETDGKTDKKTDQSGSGS